MSMMVDIQRNMQKGKDKEEKNEFKDDFMKEKEESWKLGKSMNEVI